METIKVDARGLSCPQPVLLTMEALKQDAARYEILVDDHTAQQKSNGEKQSFHENLHPFKRGIRGRSP